MYEKRTPLFNKIAVHFALYRFLLHLFVTGNELVLNRNYMVLLRSAENCPQEKSWFWATEPAPRKISLLLLSV